MTDQLNIELSAELESYRSAIEATIKPYIKIELTDDNRLTLWQSKFGGLPYMPKNFDYPKSNDGEYLYLLAQINFAEVPELKGLPSKGILQFYIAADGNMYGCDLNNPTRQDTFRVIYFPEITLNERDLIIDFSFLTQPKHNFPLEGCSGLTFQIDRAPITGGDYKFLDIFDDNLSDEAEEEYWEKFNCAGHKLLGYPYFTQEDPRYSLETDEEYILLLQIDSDSKNKIEIIWGDLGIANFFIKQSDLEKLNFSNVLYNWDCT